MPSYISSWLTDTFSGVTHERRRESHAAEDPESYRSRGMGSRTSRAGLAGRNPLLVVRRGDQAPDDPLMIPAGAHVGQPAARCTVRLRSVEPRPPTPPLVALSPDDEDPAELLPDDEGHAEPEPPSDEELREIEQEGLQAVKRY